MKRGLETLPFEIQRAKSAHEAAQKKLRAAVMGEFPPGTLLKVNLGNERLRVAVLPYEKNFGPFPADVPVRNVMTGVVRRFSALDPAKHQPEKL